MLGWTDELLCGIDEIDREHKKLFEVVKNISGTVDNSEKQEALKCAFYFLEDYVKKHFEMEEHYMRLCKYNGYSEHKIEHEKFYDDFTVLKKQYESNDSYSIIASELQGSLYHWLETHLNGFDKSLCQFLNKQDKTRLDAHPLQ